MKLLITGGAGFIGSHFIKYILKKYPNYKVINFDKLTYCGNLKNLKEVEKNPNYEFVKGDICNPRRVNTVVSRGIDVIINFAAESHVGRSIYCPNTFFKTNTLGTYILLESARKYRVKKFIQISTDKVYGSIEEGEASETHPLNPSSPYAISKAAADMIVKFYFLTFKLPIFILRFCNIFGPNQYPEKIIPLFIAKLLKNKKISLHGNGLHVREWLYVLDACEAIDLILHKGKEGDIYNVGSGIRKTNLEIARFILKELGKKEGKCIRYVKDYSVNDRRNAINSNKIKKEINWKPKYNFEEALKETIFWYKTNYNWWKNKSVKD